MTISSTNNRNDYTGNDTTAIYNYSFRVFLESDLTVTVRNTTTDVETELSLTTDYTVQDVGELSGGTITLVDAGQDWISGTSNLDTGYKLTIRRIVGLTQNTDIRNQGDFFPEVHEDAFDRLTMIDQQQQDDLERAIKLPETIASSEFDTTIPADFVGTQSLALVSNSAGDGFATGPSISAIEGAQAAATAAAASAAAAATSETNAATSETNAGTSETNAATSETNAGTSETNAAASAAAASTSETNAATSETNAATSETNAATSASNAATSETNAATSASNAATSASNAATSEANAATSATNAATSETNAATSEANAAASATAAQDAAAASQWKDVVYITNVDSPVSITDADSGKLYSVNTSGGNVVFNLPAISGLTLSAPWSIGVKKTDTSANTVTINPNGTDVIDGNASATISQAETGLVVIPDADPAPDEWTTLVFGEVPSVFEGKTFNDEITMKEITTPSAPSAGFQAIFMDSADSKLKRIDSNGDVFGVGGGAGDADTIHLIRAADQGDTDFTIKSIDDVLPDFGGSDTLTGTFSVPTTGSEALLSNDDDHKVYKYASTTGSQYDAFGVVLDVPRYQRGKDTVLQFKYRTADTSGDSANGDYMVYVFDKTNGVNTTTTSTGSKTAGSTLTVGTTTGMSVGDFILIGQASDGLVKEGYVTEVVSSTTLKVSVDLNLTSGDRFITGALTDSLTLLDAADDDTNKTGNDYKVVFNVPSTCAEVTLLFQQLTSQTDSFLYVDNILISSEVVKRVFARELSESVHLYNVAGFSSGNTYVPYFTSERTNTISKTGTLTNDSTSGVVFTASKPCKVTVSGTMYDSSSGGMGVVKNATSAELDASISAVYSKLVAYGYSLNTVQATFSGETILAAGDTLAVLVEDTVNTRTGDNRDYVSILVTPEVNDVVVVESTDSVISEWTNFTATGLWTSNVTYTGKWRRDGDTMHVAIHASMSGAADAGNMYLNLPSGYVIDTSKLSGTTVGISFLGSGTAHDNGTGSETVEVRYKDTTSVYVTPRSGSSYVGQTVPFTWASGDDLYVYFQVPIAGWDANPKPLLAFPTITYGQDAEIFRADTYAGYGSGSYTHVPYYTNVRENTVSNLGTIVNSSSGCYFTATKRCKVTAEGYYCRSASSDWFAIVKNGDGSVGATASGNNGKRLSVGYSTAANVVACATGSTICEPGDIIFMVTDNVTGSPTNTYNVGFSILVEPEEGQVNQAAIIAQPVAFVKDVKPSGTNGGTTVGRTTDYTQKRDLNTLEGDIAGVGVTLSSNQFTLPAGKFEFDFDSIFYKPASAQCKIYNVTDSKTVAISNSLYGDTGDATNVNPRGFGSVTLTKSTVFELRFYVISGDTSGLGNGLSTGENNTFSQIKITRKK